MVSKLLKDKKLPGKTEQIEFLNYKVKLAAKTRTKWVSSQVIFKINNEKDNS